jgi:carbon monoxide dehydrogenase subunit G
MKFVHEVLINGSLDAIWNVLDNIPRAASCMPGVTEMIHTENDQYQGVIQVQVGPMKFNLTGIVGVNREPDKKSWTMKARAQDNRINGGVQATIDAKLSEQSLNIANLNVTADVQFLGRIGTLGQPLIKRKADEMIQAFTKNLQAVVQSET